MHRLLRRADLMHKAANDPECGTDRRRFAVAQPGQLWMSDVMHGPSVALEGSRVRRKTYLIAFLDDANRIAHYPLSAAALAKLRQVGAEQVQCAVEKVQ